MRCRDWGVAPSAKPPNENSAQRKARYTRDNDAVYKAKAVFLNGLLAAGQARVSAGHSDPALAGKIVKTIEQYKDGRTVVGLLVRCGSASGPVAALELASAPAAAPDADAAPAPGADAPRTPPSGGDAAGGGRGTEDAVMGDADTPEWVDRAWDAFLPDTDRLLRFGDARHQYQLARGVNAPWESLPEAEFPLHLRKWASPSGSGWPHPPVCVCGRSTCPVPRAG